ncbi:MAG: hypothetical protein RI894_576 [Bacteroidota bacterium]
MKLKYILLSGLIGMGLTASAQQIPTLNQYTYNRFLYNPAVAGATGDPIIALSHKRQWDNMPNAPVTTQLIFDMPFGTNIGVGGQLFSDRSHLINNTGGMATLAYYLPLDAKKEAKLSFGLSAGVVYQGFDFQRATVEDLTDNAILKDVGSSIAFNANVGLNFKYKGLNVGLAVPQVANSNAKYSTQVSDNIRYQFERHWLAMASYKFGDVNKITVEPNLMMRSVAGLPMQFDLGALANWKETFQVGAGYRSANVFTNTAGINFTAGFNLKKQLGIAYTVETLLDGTQAGNFGASHEVIITYRFGASRETAEKIKALEDRLAANEKKADAALTTATHADSLGKMTEERVGSLEKRTDKVETTSKDLEKRMGDTEKQTALNSSNIKDLQGRVSVSEKDITDLKSRKVEATSNDIAYKKMAQVFFENGKSELTATAKAELGALKEALDHKKGNFMIYIAGHASNSGSAQANMLLSVRRSGAVKRYLENLGVKQPVLVMANGAEMNETEKDKGTDRRVDVFLSGE